MPPVITPVTYEPIKAVRVFSQQGALPALLRVPESNAQLFKLGVPTMQTGGFLVEWTTGAANTVYGVSSEQAKNYSVAGGGVSFTLPPVVPPSTDLNEPAAGPPPNQPNAVVVPMGAAIRDGLCGVYAANGQTVFSIALKVGQIFTIGLLVPGTLYGLTKDTGVSNFWFMDTTVTAGNSAVAVLLAVDPSCPNDGVNGTRVFFQFAASRRAFQ